jgi:hypothetical protein
MFSFLKNPDFITAGVLWLGAICNLGIYTILYRENRIFRFFEHLFIGVATGYTMYVAWNDVLKPEWWEPMTKDGQWWLAAFIPAGLLFYTIYSNKHAWMSRIIFGIFFGAAAGQTFQGYAAYYFPLARSIADVKLVNPPEATAPGHYYMTPFSAVANNWLFIVIVVAVMTYFFFSFEQKNAVIKNTSRLGRYVLMFSFGAIFGSTIGARMNLLIGRLYFLIHDWILVGIFRHK